MSINIYPAFIKGNSISHSDHWDECSTLNIANGNFYALATKLGISQMMTVPGHIRVKTLRMALQTTEKTTYHDRLNKLCAVAEIKKAPFIAFT